MIYTDASNGDSDGESKGFVKSHEALLEGELDAFSLAKGLTRETGLGFHLAGVSKQANGLLVEWSSESSLLSEDPGMSTEAYNFANEQAQAWFMLDSLYMTLQKNLGIENIYFASQGGGALVVSRIPMIAEFPADIPYMGSPFYYAHDDVKGDIGASESNAPEGSGELAQGLTETEAVDLLFDLLDEKITSMNEKLSDDESIVLTCSGDATRNDMEGWYVELAQSDSEKITVLEHYFVSNTGIVMKMNINGDFEEFMPQDKEEVFSGEVPWWGNYAKANGILLITSYNGESFRADFELKDGRTFNAVVPTDSNIGTYMDLMFELADEDTLIVSFIETRADSDERSDFTGTYQREQ